MVKSYNGLKGTKVFAFWVFCKKSWKFFIIYRKELLLGFFYCKAAAWNSLLKNGKVKVTRRITLLKRDAYSSTFLQVLKKLWTRLWTPMRDCLWSNVKKRVRDCDLEFSHVFIFKKWSLSHQNNSHHCGRGMIN